MKKFIMIGSLLMMVGVPVSAHAGKWSDYIAVSTEGDVVVSYRQRLQADGWFMEWRIENKTADWVEPFTNSRTYLCADGSQKMEREKTLGPYPPGEERKGGIRDRGVCLGSKIQSVEAAIELRPVSEVIRKMWE